MSSCHCSQDVHNCLLFKITHECKGAQKRRRLHHSVTLALLNERLKGGIIIHQCLVASKNCFLDLRQLKV